MILSNWPELKYMLCGKLCMTCVSFYRAPEKAWGENFDGWWDNKDALLQDFAIIFICFFFLSSVFSGH